MVEPGWAGLPNLYTDDPKIYPIHERYEELGGILAFTVSARMGRDLTFSDPSAVDRVAGDSPNLKMVVSHAFWPWVEHSCGLAFRRHNVYLLAEPLRLEHAVLPAMDRGRQRLALRTHAVQQRLPVDGHARHRRCLLEAAVPRR